MPTSAYLVEKYTSLLWASPEKSEVSRTSSKRGILQRKEQPLYVRTSL